jgi:hypothetical protein
MDISFSNPISGAGAQIQADYFGSFTATITAYGAGSTFLESFIESGDSTSNGDGSAIFLGVLDSTADIYSIQYSVVSVTGNNDFAINTLSLLDTNGTPSVPEPSTMLLVASGLAGLAAFRKRYRAA